MSQTRMALALAITALLAWTCMPAPGQNQRDNKAEVQLQAAIHAEMIDGNWKAVIEQYKKLAQNRDRAVAAKALVRMGECYEKLGNAEARKTYEQVLSRFGDQAEPVAQARARLAVLGGGGKGGQPTPKLLRGGPKATGDSISPDGRYVSYTDWDTGNLMLHDLVSGTDRALTTGASMKKGEEAYASKSAISRDGKQIAYGWWDSRTKRGEPRVVSLDGDTSPRRLSEILNCSPSDWSPDGKWIAVSAARREGDKWTRQIGLVNAQDGSLRVLKSAPVYSLIHGFSPDGKHLLYSQQVDGDTLAYVLSLDGNSDFPLLSPNNSNNPNAKTSQVYSPVWSPDGSRVVYGGRSGLWSVGFANGKLVG